MKAKSTVESQSKWVSKFNNGDSVRHVTGHEKRVINGVLFDTGAQPQYRVASEVDTKWWFESECVRVI